MLCFFLSFSERFTKTYSEIFKGESKGNEYTLEAQFGGKWGWYHAIYRLANGDVTRFDSITKLPATKCLTMLMYENDKAEVEKERMSNTKR